MDKTIICNQVLMHMMDIEHNECRFSEGFVELNPTTLEYYDKKYTELFNEISKHEFHITQIEKHINIAKKLCNRIGIDFDQIIIADDNKYDEIIDDIDINKDVYSNECYDIMHFLFNNKDYCLMLNSGEVLEQLSIKTYIKSINFIENEVYKF